MIARKALWLLAGAAVVGVMASARQDLTRYLKIKQMSYGNGHPENVPVHGTASYLRPSQERRAGWQGRSQRPTGTSTARDRTSVDPQDPIDEGSPDLQVS